MPKENELKTVYAGRHLSMLTRDGWEFVTRNIKRPVVGVVAITQASEVVLVEQYRAPVGYAIIELPAGLAGDIPGAAHEPLVEAAKRELLEETGWTANVWTELASCYSSPGLTDESIVLFLAEGLEMQHSGGGDETEEITVHKVPLAEVVQWLHDRAARADLKLLAGLFAAEQHLKARDGEQEHRRT